MDQPSDLAFWRKQLRTGLLAQRMAVPSGAHRAWSASITTTLLAAFPLLRRMAIGFYWPIKGEFDPRFALRTLRDAGAIGALPVVIRKAAPLQFRQWWPGAPVTRGVYDLPIPQGTPIVEPGAVLVPPIGFDARGYRLGYGGGFFDRTLAAMAPQPLKIGVAFELSRIATIHPQWHDIPLDFIVTEAGVHRVTDAGLERIESPSAVSALAERIVADRHGTPSATEPGAAIRDGIFGADAQPFASSPFDGCRRTGGADGED